MAKPESNFIFGEYRGKLRYRSITQWAVTLEVSTNAISNHLDQDRPFQDFINSKHSEESWLLWERFVFNRGLFYAK